MINSHCISRLHVVMSTGRNKTRFLPVDLGEKMGVVGAGLSCLLHREDLGER